MLRPGDVISYLDMCEEEGASLQRGMNYRLGASHSVILMSLRPSAPYADRVEEDGRVLVYEGHDIPRSRGGPDPKTVDQPMNYPGGTPTQNGLFYRAAQGYVDGRSAAAAVRVYEKIHSGIWAYNGLFRLVEAWQETSNAREVFKFRLELLDGQEDTDAVGSDLDHNRVVPASVKLTVWRRDSGKCVQCGSRDNLHFDHIIPYSRGGSSLVAENIQILCARHNLAKRDNIQ